MKFDVVPVLLLPADGRSGRASLYCDLGLQLEGQSTTHFPLKKNTWTHAQRSTFPLSVSHSVRTTQRQRKTAAEQGNGWTSEGKSAACSSKEGESLDLHEVNFSLNAFVPCDPAATGCIIKHMWNWFLKVRKWLGLSFSMFCLAGCICLWLLYQYCVCVW